MTTSERLAPPAEIHAEEGFSPENIPRTALEQYIEQFGLDFDFDLQPNDLIVFAAAQKLEPFVQGLKIPVATKTDSEQRTVLIEREVERIIEHTSYRESEVVSPTPANNMDVGLLDRTEDLPDVIPAEWLTEDVAPELFYQRLLNGELLKREWRDTVRKAETSYETVKDKELVEVPAPPEEKKQHAYVLMDVSGSMSGSYDRRDVLAQALALAFLRQGFEQRSQLAFRPFDTTAHDVSAGRTQNDLRRIALRILHQPMWGGGTNIQQALDRAAKDIRKGGEFTKADILLISDGEATLQTNPLGKIKLHTLLVGDSDDYYGYLSTLRNWSTTFKMLDATKYDIPFTPPREEMRNMQEHLSRAIPKLLRNMQTPNDANRLRNRVNMLVEYFGQEDEEAFGIRALVRWLKDRKRSQLDELAQLDFAAILRENQMREAERLKQEERQRQQDLFRQAEIARQEAERLKSDEEETRRLLQLIHGSDVDFTEPEVIDNKREKATQELPEQNPQLGLLGLIRKWWRSKLKNERQ